MTIQTDGINKDSYGNKEIQEGRLVYAADAEASDTYVISLQPAATEMVTGMVVNFYCTTANTGAATLNINGLGAKTIKKFHDQDLATGDIEAGQIVTVVYDGTNFQMQSQAAAMNFASVDIDGGTIDGTTIGGTTPAAGSFTTLKMTTGAAAGVVVSDGTGNLVADTTPALGTPSSGVVTNLTGTASININGTVGATTANTLRSLIDEDLEPAADTLTANQVSGGQVNNIGQGANDVNLTLPEVVEGYNFILQIGEPSANYYRITAATAGTMIVDGVVNKNYAQFSTPGIGDFLTCRAAKVAPQPSGILTGAALAQGSTTTAVANGAFTFYIAGTKYADAADAVGVAPGNDVIPQSKYGAVAFDIGTDGTMDAVEATDNATGYDSAALAIAGLPAVAASHVRTGYVTAIDTGDTFIFGTDNLATAGTITVEFTSAAAYTAVYNWICTTGAGTVTTN